MSDLVETIQWLQINDAKAQEISKNGQEWVKDHLVKDQMEKFMIETF